MTAQGSPQPVPCRFDRRAKRVGVAVLGPDGRVETEREVGPEGRRVDIWFEPDPACAESLAKLGLLGRMCAQPAAIEVHSQAPGLYTLRACFYKQLGLLPLQGGNGLELEPWMWVIGAGRPTEGLISLKCDPAPGFPPGVYLGPSAFRTGIIVVGELPITRETLLVRLLGGRDKVFQQAMREIEQLPADALERQRTLPMLRRYYMDTQTAGTEGCTGTDEQEEDCRIMMDFFEELRAEGHSKGLEKGLEQGRSQGLEKGLEQGRSQGLEKGLEKGLIAAFAARFGPMPADLRALIHKRQDKRVLYECFGFIGAASAAEAFAGLRARLNAPVANKPSARRVRGHAHGAR